MILLSDFPTVCLDRIFDHLPLPDLLYTVPRVCTRWRELHPFACHRRALNLRPLILAQTRADYEINTGEVPDSCNYDNMDMITNEDGSRYLGPKKIPLFEIQGLVWKLNKKENCSKLKNRLPGLTELVCVYNDFSTGTEQGSGVLNKWYRDPSQIDHLAELLRGDPWTKSLKTLEIHFNANCLKYFRISGDDRKRETNSWVGLMKAINSLSHLRSLTLNLQPNTDIRRIMCKLSILGQLEHFSCNSRNLIIDKSQADDWYLTPIVALKKYASNNLTFKTIALGHEHRAKMAAVMDLKPELCGRFTEFYLDDTLYSDQLHIDHQKANNLADFGRFCRRFSSLTHLEVEVGVCTLGELMGALGQLKQLVRLDLKLDRTAAHEVMPVDAYDEPHPPPMPSVRYLMLANFHALKSHTDLVQFQFEHLFPNLQVVHILNFRKKCTDCSLDEDRTKESDESWGRLEECDRLSRAPFKQCQRLKRLFYHGSMGKLFQENRPSPFREDFSRDELLAEN